MARRRVKPRRIRLVSPATVAEAMTLCERSSGKSMRGTSALVICTRIGDADFVPPGYHTADCSKCGSAVWINPDVVDESRRKGMKVIPVCFRCVGPPGGRPRAVGVPPAG